MFGQVGQYAIELAKLGYAAHCFYCCGGSIIGGKSHGKTTDMSVLNEVKELGAVIAYIHSLPYAGDKLLLMGFSQGGFVSAITAARHLDLADKLVLFYPALYIPDDARAGKMIFAKFDPNNLPKVIKCGPMKLGKCYPADVLDRNPYGEIKGVACPVLMVHGTADKIVPPDYAHRAEESCGVSANAQLYVIEDGTHSFSKKHDLISMKYLLDFA